ncbi:MAG: hypothetical protein AAFS10_15630 [Myxococcota bacterium]
MTLHGWKALLSADTTAVLPWLGGRTLRGEGRVWSIQGPLPPEHGWHAFTVNGSRRARWSGTAQAEIGRLEPWSKLRGYLVGDRLVPDRAKASVGDVQTIRDRSQLLAQTIPIRLVQPGLSRFSRICAAHYAEEVWLYMHQEFPIGPEWEVEARFTDRRATVADLQGVTPALELAFQIETWRRDQARRTRERRMADRKRQQHAVWAQTGAGRRTLAADDLDAAMRAALAVSGAELLDHHEASHPHERTVQFRYRARRFTCVIEVQTLRIVDAGICLHDHTTGERGDTYFTLESLPAVIAQAIDEGSLVVFH